MNILCSLLLTSLAGFGTLLGSLLVFVPNINKNSSQALIFTFSAVIMLYISIFDLIPSSFYSLINAYTSIKSLFIIVICFICGVGIVNIIDRRIKEESSLYKIGVLSLISLMIHNFPEGIATFMTTLLNRKVGVELTFAILAHNIPEGIMIALPISISKESRKKGIFYSFFASLSEPLGALFAFIFLHDHLNNIFISIILLIVSGIMITLAINNISEINFKKNLKHSLLGILLAVGYVFIIKLI